MDSLWSAQNLLYPCFQKRHQIIQGFQTSKFTFYLCAKDLCVRHILSAFDVLNVVYRSATLKISAPKFKFGPGRQNYETDWSEIDGTWETSQKKITKSEMGQNLQTSARNSIDESQPLLIVDKRFGNNSKNRRQFSTSGESFKCSYNGLGSLAHNLTFKRKYSNILHTTTFFESDYICH